MKALLEKIKSLDKKVLIGVGAGVAALIVAVVLILVFALGGKDTEADKQDDNTKVEQNDDKDKDENKDKEDGSKDEEKATFTVKVVDEEGTAVAGVVVQLCKEECVPVTTDATGVAVFNIDNTEGYKLSVVTCPEGYEYTGGEIALEAGRKEYELKIQKKAEEGAEGQGDLQTQKPEDVNGVEQSTVTTKPDGEEIFGLGTATEPYEEIPNLDTMTLTTVAIPAGKTLYYKIQRVGNMILTINDANAYVIESDGTRHNASSGKVSFTVEDALASDYVLFQIGNNSGSAKSFTIKFTNPTGSYQNPSSATMNTNITVNLSAGDSDGHWYKYIAERTGKIKFYLLTSPDSNGLIVTNNRNSAQRTTEADAQVDSQGTFIELDVEQGDEILINVAAKPNNRGKYPAATITWCGKYS